MNSSRQHKRKIFEAPEIHKKCTGNTVKKLICRDAGGKDTSGSPQLSARKLPQIGVSSRQTTKMLESDQQIPQQNHSAKIKLQLFPLNESIRLGLEKDGYNPFLELTLNVKKKISSVIKHMHTKWGTSAVANGELMLFPFNARVENLAVCSRWTRENSDMTAGKVHVAIGSPTLFRLRYGWTSSIELQNLSTPHLSNAVGACLESEKEKKRLMEFSESRCSQLEGLAVPCEEPTKVVNVNEAVDVASEHLGDDAKSKDGPEHKLSSWDDFTNLSIGGLLSESSLQARINIPNTKSETKLGWQTNQLISEISREGEMLLESKTKDFDQVTGDPGLQSIQLENGISIGGLLSEASLEGKSRNQYQTYNEKKLGLQTNVEKNSPPPQFSWDDNLTTLSIGGLLSEASLQGKKVGSQEVPLISDSFDAFILSQLNSNPLVSKPSLNDSHSSILDAEETCHAFTFEKFSSSRKDHSSPSEGEPSSSGCNNYSSTKPFKFPRSIENGESLHAQDPLPQPKDVSLPLPKGVHDEDSSLGLSGIKWNDSLGPFDLGLRKSRVFLNGGDSISVGEFVR